jgi:hypothetical protein
LPPESRFWQGAARATTSRAEASERVDIAKEPQRMCNARNHAANLAGACEDAIWVRTSLRGMFIFSLRSKVLTPRKRLDFARTLCAC